MRRIFQLLVLTALLVTPLEAQAVYKSSSNSGGGGGGSGTVTSVSVATAHGVSGTVANPTTTPAITLSTSVNGIAKGDGTSFSAATGDTDYQNPITLTTTGSSGAATFTGDTLNIPQYAGTAVSVTSVSPGLVVNPSPGTGTFTVGETALIDTTTCATNSSCTVASSDLGQILLSSRSTAQAVSLPNCNSGAFTIGSSYSHINIGAGTATLTSSGGFNGSPTSGTTLALAQNQGAWLTCGADSKWLVFTGAGSGGSGTITSSTSGQVPVFTAATTLGGATGFTASGTNNSILTMGVLNTTQGQVVLNGGTSGTVTLSTAAAAGTSTLFQFPATNGSAGNCLTDPAGDGVSVWGSCATTSSAITSSSATAFAVGLNGATNPVLNIDASTASQVGGITIKGGATGGTTTITATDSGSNQGLTIASKGSGNLTINTGSSGNLNLQFGVSNYESISSGQLTFSPGISNTATSYHYIFNNPADSAITASTESQVFQFGKNTGNTRTHATGSLTLQREAVFTGQPHAFAAASTVTDLATIGWASPGCSTNATCTNVSGLIHQSTALVATGTITNSYGINVAADTGATNNYSATFTGGNGFVTDAIISKGTKFTTSGCSISSTTGGATAGVFTLGANSCTAVITLNGATGSTAPNGWTCQAHDRTAPTILIGGESSSTTTTASITIPAGAGTTDVISFSCTGY